ncbi:MAG: flagellar biosynthesis anti-sigma factor FlgM [Hydrogenophilaceae bacterium]|nr:flagellar biosynthesis anti-sigma factor FlgM [Hydrogenophilaceae bacterium]
MKIDPSLLTQVGLEPDTGSTRKPRQNDPLAPARQAGGDIQIKLSPTLQGIEKTLASLDINQSRVDAIKQALASGQYQISPERIANGLISTSMQHLVNGDKS